MEEAGGAIDGGNYGIIVEDKRNRGRGLYVGVKCSKPIIWFGSVQ